MHSYDLIYFIFCFSTTLCLYSIPFISTSNLKLILVALHCTAQHSPTQLKHSIPLAFDNWLFLLSLLLLLTYLSLIVILGVIQLRNWKPLTFDQISDSADATVGDILGDISSVATLRIRIYRYVIHT